MDNKTNIRKIPFGYNKTPKEDKERKEDVFQDKRGFNKNINENIQKINPPIKSSVLKKESVKNIQQNRPITNIIENLCDNRNPKVEIENILKEYESLKNYNSSKGFIRCTTERIPGNKQIISDVSVSIGLIINPLAYYEPEVPVVSYGENEIPRCISGSCRAYINPFIKWIDNGDKWICNLCKTINYTENYYYNKLDSRSNRLDFNNKPDLSTGTYEFIANKSYTRKDRPVCTPTFIFIIDVSLSSIQNGFLSAVIESIKDTINNDLIQYGDRVNIGLITYDYNVNFYVISPDISQPHCLTVSEENIFLPTTKSKLLVALNQNKSKILYSLDLIQTSYSHNNCRDSNRIFDAINAGYLICKENGGKLIVFNASQSMTNLPIVKSANSLSISKEDVCYSPTDDRQISSLGINLTNENISCDVFVTNDNFINLITLNQICTFTNGNLYFYKNFRLETNYKNIFNQIRRVLSRPMSWEAVMRTRLSKGYRISSFITPILITNTDLMILSTLDSDQTFALQIEPIPLLETNPQNQIIYADKFERFVFVQSAILYTHYDGSRRIRVLNLCLPVVDRIIEVFEGVDPEALACFLVKFTIDKIFKTKKITNSVLLLNTMVKGMISCAISAYKIQKKELPGNLISFVGYLLGAVKHRIFCKDEVERKLDIDLSNYMRIKIQKLSCYDMQAFIYPMIYPLHKKFIDYDGLYLIDNGFLLIIYITQNVKSILLQSLFGVKDKEKLYGPFLEDVVFSEPDEIKQKIINIVDYIRSTKAIFQNLVFSFQYTESEIIIRECLIEDNLCPWCKYDYDSFYRYLTDSYSYSSRPDLR